MRRSILNFRFLILDSRRHVVKTMVALLLLQSVIQSPKSKIVMSAIAAFEDTGTGARPTALGGTYVAVGDDVQSLMYNPAGLAALRYKEVTSEYSRLYVGLTDNSNLSQFFLGYGQPIKYGGTLAFGWRQFSLDSLYTERTLSLGYGAWMTSRVAGGVAVKQLYHSFGAPNIIVDDAGNIQSGSPSFYAQNGTGKGAFSGDLGMLVRMTERHTLGVSIQDINEPDIALSGTDKDIVPRTIRLGTAYQGRQGLLLTGALTTRESLPHQRDYTWTGAAEKWWRTQESGAFAARGSLAQGSREFSQFGMGAGYRLDGFQIDYAFVFNLSGIAIGRTAGTHRFSVGYRFGGEQATKKKVMTSTATPSSWEEDLPLSSTAQTVTPVAAATPLGTGSGGSTADLVREAGLWPGPTASPGPPPLDTAFADLLRKISASLTRFMVLTRRDPGVSKRLSPLTPLFYDSTLDYDPVADTALPDLLEAFQMMEDRKRFEAFGKGHGVTEQERLDYAVNMIERHLEPAMLHRHWDGKDRRALRYLQWLKSAWAYDHYLGERHSARSRLDFLDQILRKAIAFENQPSEPLAKEREAVRKPRGSAALYRRALISYSRSVQSGLTGPKRISLTIKNLKQCERIQGNCEQIRKELLKLMAAK